MYASKLFLPLALILSAVPLCSMEQNSVVSALQPKYQTMQSNTYTIKTFKELVELKKRQAEETKKFLAQIDSQQVKADKEQFGEIEESARFNLLMPQIEEGAAYKPSLDFVISPYFGVMIAVDVVALKKCDDILKAIILRKEKGPKDKRVLGYATIGGMTENGQTFEQCGAREAYEEAGITIDANSLVLIGAYSDPTRDPRKIMIDRGETKIPVQRHVASIAYVALTNETPQLTANTEGIKDIQLMTLEEIMQVPTELWLAKDMLKMCKVAFTSGRSKIELRAKIAANQTKWDTELADYKERMENK